MSNNGHKQALHFHHPPRRVISLVPSLTESLFDLGLGGVVVGITDYCLSPAKALSGLPRLGGPKNPRISDILDLKPDLVLANQEENTQHTIEALEKAGIGVWVSFPQTVRKALDVLWVLVGIFNDPAAAARLETLEITVDWCESSLSGTTPRRYFCPIWEGKSSASQQWWMVFNQLTYANDVLRLAGGENVFAPRERRYPLDADLGKIKPHNPGKRDTRYPRVTLEEIQAANPELILLPSEPFKFEEKHRQVVCELLAETPAVREGRVHLVDGSLITWHGTRLARALQDLPSLFHQ